MSKHRGVFWDAAKAFRNLKSQPGLAASSVLADFLFFFVYGFVTRPLMMKISEYVVIIGTSLSEKAAQVARGAAPNLGSLITSDPEISPYFNSLILMFLLFGITSYVIYVFFQAIAWRISFGIAGIKNPKIYNFMKEFALLNVFWLVFAAVIHFLFLFSKINEAVITKLDPLAESSFGKLAAVFFFAVIYFAFISYTLVGKKLSAKSKIAKSFQTGVKKIKLTAQVFLAIAAVYFILDYALGAVVEANYIAGLILVIAIFLPALAWARVFLIISMEKVKA